MYSGRFRKRILALIFFVTVQGSARAASGFTVQGAVATGSPIVRITGIGPRGGSIAEGIGFYVRRNLIATSYQVVKDGLSFKASSGDGKPLGVTLIGVNEQRTVALLTADESGGIPALTVRYEQELTAGDELFVGVPRDEQIVTCRLGSDLKTLKLERALNSSYAGSPVLNKMSEVVGLLGAPSGGTEARLEPISSLTDVGGIVTAGSARESEARKAAAARQESRPDMDNNNSRVLSGQTSSRENKASTPPPGTIRFKPLSNGSDGQAVPPALSQTPAVIRKTGNALMESAIRHAEPPYPSRAKAANISGIVQVDVTIDSQGYVTSAKGVSGPQILRGPAQAAAMAYLFSPTIEDGKLVEVTGTLRFLFRPSGSAQPASNEPAATRPIPHNDH